MSQQNVQIIRDGYERFSATGDLTEEIITADFVWSMSSFHGWPERQEYLGIEGARTFLREWSDAWEDWELEIDALHAAGDKVVVVLRQRGRSKAAGMPVEMSFAQVWTLRDGKQARMDMYSDSGEALEAAGLSE